MSTIDIAFNDRHAVITLNRPKGHAINQEMVSELTEAFVKLADAPSVEGVILTSSGRIFSAGLDVVELYDYNEGQMVNFWGSFARLVRDIIAFPKPTVCAINGQSPAGGCILAMACDHRVMAFGEHRIGLNEVPVGVVVPHFGIELARATVGSRKAAQMFYNGLLMEPDDACAFGIVDETCTPEELMIFAETKLQKWIDMPKVPWEAAKRSVRGPLLDLIGDIDPDEDFRETLTCWWDDATRTQVGKLVAKLTKK